MSPVIHKLEVHLLARDDFQGRGHILGGKVPYHGVGRYMFVTFKVSAPISAYDGWARECGTWKIMSLFSELQNDPSKGWPMGFSFVVAVWIAGPRFALTKNFSDMLRRRSPTPQDLSIWDLASHFGFTGRPKFPTKRSKHLQHSPCPCGHLFLNIAG